MQSGAPIHISIPASSASPSLLSQVLANLSLPLLGTFSLKYAVHPKVASSHSFKTEAWTVNQSIHSSSPTNLPSSHQVSPLQLR